MDNLKYLTMKSDKITNDINIFIKKSRKIREHIINKLTIINKETFNQIIEILLNDIYEYHNLQSIIILGQLVNPSINWDNINKILISYNEEFYQDSKIFEIINKITKYVSENDIQLKYTLKYLSENYKKYGCHLDDTKKQEIINLYDKIEELKDKLNYIILSENYIPLDITQEQDKQILSCKYLKKYIIINNDKYFIKLNKKNCDIILFSSKIENIIKNNIYELIKRNNMLLSPDIYKIIKYRYELSNKLKYNSYSELINSKCMNNNNLDIIRDLVIGLDKTSKIELSYIFQNIFSKNMSEVDFNNILYNDFKKIITDYKQKLILNIGSFNLYKSIDEIIDIFQNIFLLKFTLIRNTTNFNIWSDNVKIYLISENDGTKLGFIYFDLDFTNKSCCMPTCVNIMKYANYPLNTNNFILPACALIANYNKDISYYDIVALAHELSHAIHCLMGKNKYFILNGIVCEDDFIEIPGIIIEQYMWEEKNITQMLKINNKDINLKEIIKQLHTLDIGLSLKNKCSIALFDQFIHTSSQFIKICDGFPNNNISLYNMLSNSYKNIIGQVMNDIEPCNKWLTFDNSLILTISQDNSSQLSNMLISEIIATNLYNRCFDKSFFYKFRYLIMNNFKMNNKDLLNSVFTYEPKIIDIMDDLSDEFTINNDNDNQNNNLSDNSSDENSETNKFDVNGKINKINISFVKNSTQNVFAKKN
jgi:Zn-dependent oligopeptidase